MSIISYVKNAIKNGISPEQLINKIPTKYKVPVLNNLIAMAKSNSMDALNKFADNFCRERGIDYKTEFPKFMEKMNKNS